MEKTREKNLILHKIKTKFDQGLKVKRGTNVIKKVSRMFIGLCLVLSIALSAMAGTIVTPVYPKDYKKYKPFTDPTTAGNNVIPGWGYIGVETSIKPNPDPEKPPIPDSELINVEVPTQFIWAAFSGASPAGAVVSPVYIVKNNDPNVNLELTMLSFKQITGAGIDSIPEGSYLSLNLITDFGNSITDVLDPASQNFTFSDTLDPGSINKFSIRGVYFGSYAKVAKPKYEMVLKFAVKNIVP